MYSPANALSTTDTILQKTTSPTLLPTLQNDVLAFIFSFLGRADIQKARTVCRTWRNVVDLNEAELWRARCDALDLLPKSGRGVLNTCANETLAHVESASNRVEKAKVYRQHFLTWVPHVCRFCEPVDWSVACRRCTRPKQFRWVKWNPCFSARSVHCETPPYAPLSVEQAGILYRLDDIMKTYPRSDTMEEYIRKYIVVMH